MKKKIYLAAPLFCDSEMNFNIYLESLLSSKFDVFLPQRDNGLVFEKIENGGDIANSLKGVFDGDIEAIKKCDILLILLDGRSVDEGACFELGYAFSLGKQCIGLKTDSRQLMKHGNNPMITQALSSCFASVTELKEWVSGFDNE
ncbi:nucleoside 2-deoxyribosyltransferase [Vibrio alginolyticus]|nr:MULTISPECIES: nucleoside 2-deoxyribosyltransferase [Vibrio]EGQ9572202.1 nucleoside 2-deoxyribosyltransferase [Vibrio alginolyticus]EGR1572548.1 nucleoside 2-deoxyribosyltransferase [Vibrio alginolyticus]EHK9062562.1 nucleoside 2-deoxyribosyltransferase [Vibrio parahaemolyticus]ELA7316104.1 nucleoside 2-deoxyribosyltransferase [Vibrio alginolyticus]ELB2734161.1 nucleoside 2-deoxyribosyltransferase [Vibrio alginolyticus]